MDDFKKKQLIKCAILVAVSLALAGALSYFRYKNFTSTIDTRPILHALSDGFIVIGFLNLGFGALVKISATGFFDIFGFAARSFLNFFIPRSMISEKANYYEYKVKKAEKRKEITFFRYMLILGVVMILLAIVFNLLVYA